MGDIFEPDQPESKPTNDLETSSEFISSFRFIYRLVLNLGNVGRPVRADTLTAVSTFAIFLVTAVAAGVGIGQWDVLNGTLSEMRGEQRAWVSQSLEAEGIMSDGVVVVLGIKTKLNNYGKLPALNAWIWPAVYVTSGNDLPRAINTDSDVCVNRTVGGVGIAVFPGEETSLIKGGVIATPFPNGKTITHNFSIIIVGCTLYVSVGDKQIHKTPFAFIVGAENGSNFDLSKWVIDKTKITLLPVPINSEPD